MNERTRHNYNKEMRDQDVLIFDPKEPKTECDASLRSYKDLPKAELGREWTDDINGGKV